MLAYIHDHTEWLHGFGYDYVAILIILSLSMTLKITALIDDRRNNGGMLDAVRPREHYEEFIAKKEKERI